jgi:glycoprotein endo-alpha-1,2-mannosidase
VVDFGAYYYPWYEAAQWAISGFVHTPQLKLYDSSDPTIISQHILWAKQYGIRFFAVSWPGKTGLDGTLTRSDQNLAIHLLPLIESNGFEFALLYETSTKLPPNANKSIDLNTPGYADRLAADIKSASAYFDHSCYRRVDGKPLVILYLARSFVGDVAGAIRKVREAAGEIYLVGDEVYWGGIVKKFKIGPPKLRNPERVKLYDGVTAYNMHTSDTTKLASFEKNIQAEFQDWSKALSSVGVDFIPSAIPGYDDSRVPGRNNPPLSRSPERFNKQLDIAARFVSKPNLVMITSFNEWHEDTQIEPAENYESGMPFSYLEPLNRRRIE